MLSAPTQQKLRTKPLTLKEANEYVDELHRHHNATAGGKFAIGVIDETDTLRGVAISGRPVARHLDNGYTLEVNRVCTDGCPNACSKLYQACARIAKEMGYRQIITYILETEPGTSLIASGWKNEGSAGGGSWDCQSRPRIQKAPTCKKVRYSRVLN
jgi:hypothetical protein